MLFGIGIDPYDLKIKGRIPFPITQAVPNVNSENVYTIEIPFNAKQGIREQLKKMGFDESRMFPELEHISEYVKTIY